MIGTGYYTPKDVREILGLSTSKVYEMLESGIIPAIRIGSRWKIPVGEFEEWIHEFTQIQTEQRREKARSV